VAGDYHTAMRTIEHIELNKKGLHSRVPKCQITLYYYVGFSYTMMRRYAVCPQSPHTHCLTSAQDAVRTFAAILVYILRTQPYHTRSSGYDFLCKKKEHVCTQYVRYPLIHVL
jgi:translation initiation factor 3 subunit L